MAIKETELNIVYVGNRGEIAGRIARTLVERGKRLKRPIRGIVPRTFTDSNPIASRIALEHLDEGWEIAQLGGTRQEQNFTNNRRLTNDARLHSAEAMALGYGFNSEDPNLVRMLAANGIVPVTPPAEAMDIGINKIASRKSAFETYYKPSRMSRYRQIPIVPGTGHLVNLDEVLKAAKDLGFPKYPVMGIDPFLGGGLGHGEAKNEAELIEVYTKLTSRPENTQFFLERLIRNPLHVEVQIVGDQQGHVVALGERDCTMQYRHQKVVEEAPSPNISRRLATTLQRAAVAHAKELNYYSVGTWEFILDKDDLDDNGDPKWYFMEVNPRIQVEHTVTEEAIRIRDLKTGELKRIDIVDLMLDIAEGKPLPFNQNQVVFANHAIQARVYARNVDRNFEAIPGRVNRLWLPDMENIRVDAAVEEGDELSGWFDETKFKAISHYPIETPFASQDRRARVDIQEAREPARGTLVEFLSLAEVPESDANSRIQVLESAEFRTGAGATVNTVEQINRRNLNERIRSIDSLLGENGQFIPYDTSKRFVPGLMLQNPTVLKRNVNPETKEVTTTPTTYSEYLEQQKRKTGKEVSANYGIVKRDGIRFVLYDLAGNLGTQEGNTFEDAAALAETENLVLVSVVHDTAGADQWQNNLALHQMSRSIDALRDHKPLMHFVVFSGGVYGGVPASFAGQGIKIGVDGPNNNTGFSGPVLVLAETGKLAEEPGAQAAYEALRKQYPGAHSNLKHYQDRNHHILAHSLGEAGDIITNFIHTLPLPKTKIDPKAEAFALPQRVSLVDSAQLAQRVDRPGAFPVFIGKLRDGLERFKHHEEAYIEPLTINQRMEVITKATRLTGAEILDPNYRIVDRVALLASPPFQFKDELEQYPSIISGAVKIAGRDLFVIAQQTQRIWDDEGKMWRKKYVGQTPADWRYTQEVVEEVARPLKMPILLLVDTNGADPSIPSESQNQSTEISNMLKIFSEYPYGVMSGLIGLKGSGGGETFGAPYDFSFSAKNSLSFVATPMASYWILTNLWVDGKAKPEEVKELAAFIEQLKDVTAEGRFKLKLTDAIVDEGAGGAHLHPEFYARNLRRTILYGLDVINSVPAGKLLEVRTERSKAPNNVVSVPAHS